MFEFTAFYSMLCLSLFFVIILIEGFFLLELTWMTLTWKVEYNLICLWVGLLYKFLFCILNVQFQCNCVIGVFNWKVTENDETVAKTEFEPKKVHWIGCFMAFFYSLCRSTEIIEKKTFMPLFIS